MLLRFNSPTDSKLAKAATIIYRLFIGFFLFDLDIICLTELTQKLDMVDQEFSSLIASYFCSMLFITIILIDLIMAISLFKANPELKEERIYDNYLVDHYSDDLSLKAQEKMETFAIFGYLRFLLIDILIASMQMLNRTQITLIVFLDIIFFWYFLRKVCKKKNIFNSRFTLIKHLTFEISILIVLVNISVFSYTEKTGFRNTFFSSFLEILTMLCIAVAILGEVLAIVMGIVRVSREACKKWRQKQNTKPVILGLKMRRGAGDKETKPPFNSSMNRSRPRLTIKLKSPLNFQMAKSYKHRLAKGRRSSKLRQGNIVRRKPSAFSHLLESRLNKD